MLNNFESKRKTAKLMSLALIVVAVLATSGAVFVATAANSHSYAQVTTIQGNKTVTTPGGPSTIVITTPPAQPPAAPQAADSAATTPWAAVASGIIVAITALALFLHYQKTGLGQKLVELVKDKEFQKAAIRDLAMLAAEAFSLNKDGTVSQNDYDVFMETKVKPLITKYAGQFGVAEQVNTILNGLMPRFSPPPTMTTLSGQQDSSSSTTSGTSS